MKTTLALVAIVALAYRYMPAGPGDADIRGEARTVMAWPWE
jgi:hypothetical protein